MEFKIFTFVVLLGFIFIILYNYSENQSYIETLENQNTDSSNFTILTQVAKNTGLLSNLKDSVDSLTTKMNSLTSKEELFDSQMKTIQQSVSTNSSNIDTIGKLAQQNKDGLMTLVNQAKSNVNQIQQQRDQIQFT